MNDAAIGSSTYVANLPLSWQVAGVGDFAGTGQSGILWRNRIGQMGKSGGGFFSTISAHGSRFSHSVLILGSALGRESQARAWEIEST